MEDKKSNPIIQELYYIAQTILSNLGILEQKELKIKFKNSIKKLKLFETNCEEDEINIYIYFMQKLFLDENKKFDFDINILYKTIKKNDAKKIFDSLMNNLIKQDFFQFLLDIGEIFSSIYFNYDDIESIKIEYEHKNITNYECILNILSKCKRKKPDKLVFDNYENSYIISYLNKITNHLKFAININYQLSLSSPNYQSIIHNSINNNFFQYFEDEKKQLIEIEKFIKKSIDIYWCNSYFYFEESLDDFLCLFYDFITEKNTKVFNNQINNKIKDEFSRKYTHYISSSFQKLFDNFTQDSLNEFGLSLYNFINNYKNDYQTNEVIELVLRIEKNFHISKEILGLISMVCFNRAFISDVKKKIDDLKPSYDDNDITNISSELCLNNYENYVLTQLILDKMIEKEKKIEKTDFIHLHEELDKNKISSNNAKEIITINKNEENIINLSEGKSIVQNILIKSEIKDNDNLKGNNITGENPIQQKIFEEYMKNNEDISTKNLNNENNNHSLKNMKNFDNQILENEKNELKNTTITKLDLGKYNNLIEKICEIEKSNNLIENNIGQMIKSKELNKSKINELTKNNNLIKNKITELKIAHNLIEKKIRELENSNILNESKINELAELNEAIKSEKE